MAVGREPWVEKWVAEEVRWHGNGDMEGREEGWAGLLGDIQLPPQPPSPCPPPRSL